MQISDEIIKVLEYLCTKIGLTIDWTSSNVLPYVYKVGDRNIYYMDRNCYCHHNNRFYIF